jgi:glycosyltransferase involved in cell wall biosynthesis
MIIGIDGRALTNGRRSGIEEYVYQIINSLALLYPQHEFRVFYNGAKKLPANVVFPNYKNLKIIEGKFPNRFIDFTGVFFDYPKVDKLLGGIDIFFSPHFFWASLAKCPRVITFHDLSFIRYSEFFPWQKRLWHWRMFIKRQIASASHFIAVSNSTKLDLMEYFDVREDKISVIYEGINHKEFRPISKDSKEILDFKRRNNLPEKFFLYLGTVEPRKNIISILEAYRLCRKLKLIPSEIYFVIAGNIGWLAKDVISLMSSPGFKDLVIFRSNVKSEERVFWYASAEALIFPSYFEGFGLPPLEAMACGIPVITSNRSSISEVVGDGAIMIDPFRPEEIAFSMSLVINDEVFKEDLRNKALNRAKFFSWERTAKATFDIFQKII